MYLLPYSLLLICPFERSGGPEKPQRTVWHRWFNHDGASTSV